MRLPMAANEPVQNNRPATGGATGKGFKPGKSGNPGGRPKGLASRVREAAPADELADYFAAIWKKDLTKLAELKIDATEISLADRNKAADWLSERGYGKPASFALVEDPDPLGLNEEDLNAAVDRFAAEVVRLAPAPDPEGSDGGDGTPGERKPG